MATMEIPIASEFDALETEFGPVTRLVDHPASILSVSQWQTDHEALLDIVDNALWQVNTAEGYQEATLQLRNARIALVFCECSLLDGTWKDVLGAISQLDEPPLLVVTAKLADDFLWSEVLNLGGYDVIAKPFIEEEVRHVLAAAWMQRPSLVRHTRVRAAS
jgi:DNA-binding response OmpR family regulator